jgi:hypothetical protein
MSSVSLAATDGMLPFELSMAYEVFGTAPAEVAGPWYDLDVCGPDAVRFGRFRLEPDHGLDRLRSADTVIVPGWADIDEDPPADLVERIVEDNALDIELYAYAEELYDSRRR